MVVLIPTPHFVSQITFDNTSSYHLDVEVSSGPHEGWMSLGTVERHGKTSIDAIYDIGDVWIFRYTAQGQTSGAFRLTREELTKDKWRVRVPEVVGAELEARNVPLQP